MARYILLSVLVVLTGCGTVNIENVTPSVWRSSDSTYMISGVARPTRSTVSVLEIRGARVRPEMPFRSEYFGLEIVPLSSEPGSAVGFFGSVPVDPCEEVINLQFQIDYERREAGGTVRKSKFDRPDREPAHTVVIRGASPLSCGDGEGFSNVHRVDRTFDAVDAQPGDGICDTGTAPTGTPQCTLRAAIMEANASRGIDTIEIENGIYQLTLDGPRAWESDPAQRDRIGDLDIQRSVNIVGDTEALVASELGVVIDGMDSNRIFDVYDADLGRTIVKIEGVSIVNGNGSAEAGESRRSSGFGGAVFVDNSVLELNRVRFFNNRALSGAAISAFDSARVYLNAVEFQENTAVNDGGAVRSGRGAFVDVSNSSFIDNVAGSDGGAIHARPNGALVSNSTFYGNRAEEGSALYAPDAIGIANSTFAFNSASVGSTIGPIPDRNHEIDNSFFYRNEFAERTQCGVTLDGLGGNVYTSACGDITEWTGSFIPAPPIVTSLSSIGFTQSFGLPDRYIDKGLLLDFVCWHQDQVGNDRPSDGDGDGVKRCDPGAIEVQSVTRPPRPDEF